MNEINKTLNISAPTLSSSFVNSKGDIWWSPNSPLVAQKNTNSDQLFRVRVSAENNSASIRMWDTREVYAGIVDYFNQATAQHEIDIALLNDVIDWQAQTIDYNALQQAFQFGAISEEEFTQEVEKYVKDEHQLADGTMLNSIARLSQIMRRKLTLDDYSNLYSVNSEALEKSSLFLNSADQLEG